MMPLIVSLVILLAVAGTAAWSLRGKQVTAPVVVACAALAGGVGITGYWVDNYTTCLSRRDGREDVRAVFTGLYNTLETLPLDADGQRLVSRLRTDLDQRLPPIHCREALL